MFGSHLLSQYPFVDNVPTGQESTQTPLYLILFPAHLEPATHIPFLRSNPELQAIQNADEKHEKQFELQA